MFLSPNVKLLLQLASNGYIVDLCFLLLLYLLWLYEIFTVHFSMPNFPTWQIYNLKREFYKVNYNHYNFNKFFFAKSLLCRIYCIIFNPYTLNLYFSFFTLNCVYFQTIYCTVFRFYQFYFCN